MGKLTREQFGVLCAKAKTLLAAEGKQVLVCAGTGCVASGSMASPRVTQVVFHQEH